MRLSDFQFELPDELIARYPTAERTASRLMVLNGADGAVRHARFADLLGELRAGDLLVFNNTRVLPARLFGRKPTGGRVEILVERLLDEQRVLAHMRASQAARPGTVIQLTATAAEETERARCEVLGRQGDLFELTFEGGALAVMQAIGHMPLPPYIDRPDEGADRERYQTVFAQRDGAVAAPTAGLHFSETFLEQCRAAGVDLGFVTLHVGAGTFQPIRVEDIREHQMHAEWIDVDAGLCEQIRQTRARGGRVIAVGTTSVRALESATDEQGITAPLQADTRIFIYPGYRFRCIDLLVTNFHLPDSTLMLLISALAGREHVLSAYQQAIAERYRFFSYGDAMLIYPKPDVLLERSAP